MTKKPSKLSKNFSKTPTLDISPNIILKPKFIYVDMKNSY